jgi:hypothetical protein
MWNIKKERNFRKRVETQMKKDRNRRTQMKKKEQENKKERALVRE